METQNDPSSEITAADDPKAFGRVFKRRRRQLGMTQAEAAAMCRVGTRFLSDLENGKATLHLGLVLRVLKAVGLTVRIKRRGFGHG